METAEAGAPPRRHRQKEGMVSVDTTATAANLEQMSEEDFYRVAVEKIMERERRARENGAGLDGSGGDGDGDGGKSKSSQMNSGELTGDRMLRAGQSGARVHDEVVDSDCQYSKGARRDAARADTRSVYSTTAVRLPRFDKSSSRVNKETSSLDSCRTSANEDTGWNSARLGVRRRRPSFDATLLRTTASSAARDSQDDHYGKTMPRMRCRASRQAAYDKTVGKSRQRRATGQCDFAVQPRPDGHSSWPHGKRRAVHGGRGRRATAALSSSSSTARRNESMNNSVDRSAILSREKTACERSKSLLSLYEAQSVEQCYGAAAGEEGDIGIQIDNLVDEHMKVLHDVGKGHGERAITDQSTRVENLAESNRDSDTPEQASTVVPRNREICDVGQHIINDITISHNAESANATAAGARGVETVYFTPGQVYESFDLERDIVDYNDNVVPQNSCAEQSGSTTRDDGILTGSTINRLGSVVKHTDEAADRPSAVGAMLRVEEAAAAATNGHEPDRTFSLWNSTDDGGSPRKEDLFQEIDASRVSYSNPGVGKCEQEDGAEREDPDFVIGGKTPAFFYPPTSSADKVTCSFDENFNIIRYFHPFVILSDCMSIGDLARV